MDIKASIIEKIENADKAGANSLIKEWVSENGYEGLVVDVLGPILNTVGKKWEEKEELSLAHAYVASKVAEDILQKMKSEKHKVNQILDMKGPVVLGNIEDDFHGLGRKMVSTFLQADGWTVHDLGNDVEPQTFVEEAINVGAKVIGVSAMMYTAAQHIHKVRSEIDNRGLKNRIQLAVGGTVFLLRPELVEEFGADGTSKNALDAPKLFARLWNYAEQNDASNE